MAHKKSLITVKDATRMAFSSMDDTFPSIRLCQSVRNLTGRAYLMDGTVLRRLRELRDKEPEKVNYRIFDYEKSIYKKHV